MGDYIVEMEHITKSFSGVRVLKDVSFRLRAGEVLALLGENGTGKSTLMKIMSGVYTRDSGTYRLFGKEQGNLTPKAAQGLGIEIIHQELNMCGHLTVAENIFLGREKKKGWLLDKSGMNAEAGRILQKLGLDIDPAAVVGDLPVSRQQLVEIAKAVSSNAKIIIMDEPTSALTDKEIEDLFRIIRQLRSEGCGIVYISHRLDELQHIVDRVTVMRDGEYITSMDFKDVKMDELIRHMVGREVKEQFPRVRCSRGKKIFEVQNLKSGKAVKNVSFVLYEGEVLGIAGLMGAGRTETTRAIFGADPLESGAVFLDGKQLSIRSPLDAIRSGIVLIPEDRKKDGLCVNLSVEDNLALTNMDQLCTRAGVLSEKKKKNLVDAAIQNLKVKLAGSGVDAGTLSGGNQQKIVIGKWLARASRVIIFDEPTRGIDVAAKVEIYNLINQLKQQGIGIICVSSELPEIMGISDRIIVMCNGRITGEVQAEETTQQEIMTYATEFEEKDQKNGGKK